jgi:hypothetical protein
MDSKNCRSPIANCRLNGFARAARFGVRRFDAAFARLADAGFALLFAGDRLQFQWCAK